AFAWQAGRQPAPEPGADGNDRPAADRVAARIAAAGVDVVGAVDPCDSAVAGQPRRFCAAPAGSLGSCTRPPYGVDDPAQRGAYTPGAGVSSLRSGLQPRRHRTHAVAFAGVAAPPVAVESLQRGRPHDAGGRLGDRALDVDGAGVRRCGRAAAGRPAPGGLAGGPAGAAGLVRLALADV